MRQQYFSQRTMSRRRWTHGLELRSIYLSSSESLLGLGSHELLGRHSRFHAHNTPASGRRRHTLRRNARMKISRSSDSQSTGLESLERRQRHGGGLGSRGIGRLGQRQGAEAGRHGGHGRRCRHCEMSRRVATERNGSARVQRRGAGPRRCNWRAAMAEEKPPEQNLAVLEQNLSGVWIG